MVNQKKTTIHIEMNADFDGDYDTGQVSPASGANPGYKNATVKMAPVGNEINYPKEKWPRADNIFMGKQSLSYQEYESAIWKNREVKGYEKYAEWGMYVILGILTGLSGFLMDTIEETLVHFKDHFT